MNTFGIQLHSLKNIITRENLIEILNKLCSFGYSEVELFENYGFEYAELSEIVSNCGLNVLGVHSFEADLVPALKTGSEFMIYSHSDIHSEAEAEALGNMLCTLSEKAAMSGLRFCYHSHSSDFIKLDGGDMLFNTVMKNAGDLCEWVPDVGLIQYAKCDPFKLMRDNAGRFPIVHLRQINNNNEFCEFDKGIIALGDVVKLGNLLGCEHFIAELPSDRTSLEDVEKCAEFLKAL